MDFTLDETEELLASSATTLLERHWSTAQVRAYQRDTSVADALWSELAAFSALGTGPLTEAVLFFRACGAALVPGPFFAHAALFVPVLTAAGHSDAAAAEAGTVIGTVALAGRSGEWIVNDDPVRTFVLDADVVTRHAVVEPGPSVRLVESLAGKQTELLDWTRRAFECPLAEPAAGTALPVDPAALDAVIARATVCLAAETVGAAGWVLDATLQHARDRQQFGRPIGSFQAVQHLLADMALDVERATSAVYYAAMAIDARDPNAARAVHVAKAAADRAALHCAKDGIQLHGGIGYTWDHDLHLYIRRIYTSATLLGTRQWHHDRLAAMLLDRPAEAS